MLQTRRILFSCKKTGGAESRTRTTDEDDSWLSSVICRLSSLAAACRNGRPVAWLLIPVAPIIIAACCVLPFAKSSPVSNDRCHVCHINYAEEKLAVKHAKHGVGCERCHGPSDEHCGSESHEIAPDCIYPRDKVPPACLQCHGKRALAKQDMHNLNLVATPQAKKICTDCHSTHRLARRQVRWDKATRKLLPPS